MRQTDRRRFLQILGGASAALIPGCGAGAPLPTAPVKASALAVGDIAPMPDATAFVARDANGLYAFSSLCTHEGCDMRSSGGVRGNQILCSCHTSIFDANGNALSGPARTPLDHYKVTVLEDDTVSVDTNTIVAPRVRL